MNEPFITNDQIFTMAESVEHAIEALSEEEREGRTGGICTVLSPTLIKVTGLSAGRRCEMACYQIGLVSGDKVEKYAAYSAEKALRLLLHVDDMLSWQSRDEENGKWGGAIRSGSLIFSFSGLPWMADEAAMLEYCVASERMGLPESIKFARISGNDLYLKLAVDQASQV